MGLQSEYDGVVDLLNADRTFAWQISVPQDRPLQTLANLSKSYRFLVRQLDDRISRSDCILVLAGIYAAHRGWIQSEIEAAKDFGKPIIAIRPRGNVQFPDAVMHAATESVGWMTSSITTAIRKHAVLK